MSDKREDEDPFFDEVLRLTKIIIEAMKRLGQPLTSDSNDIDSVSQERNRIVSETLAILGRSASECTLELADDTGDTDTDERTPPARVHLSGMTVNAGLIDTNKD